MTPPLEVVILLRFESTFGKNPLVRISPHILGGVSIHA